MRSVCDGDCNFAIDVRELSDWINEIHRWGLSVHGPNCENDIKICIASRSGGSRVSDFDSNIQ